MRGPVPDDPDVRHASAGLARLQLEQYQRQRRYAPALFSLLLLSAVVMALTNSAWWWLSVAVFVLLLISQLWTPHQLRRRLALLEAQH